MIQSDQRMMLLPILQYFTMANLLIFINLPTLKNLAVAVDVLQIKENYERLTKCLRYNRKYNLHYPSDADYHYSEILNVTAKFRGHPIHHGGNYSGPWMENYFIDRFSSEKLNYFGGLFPLFVQWSDYQLRNRNSIPDNVMFDDIRAILRPNVLYIAVSQANHGLHYFSKFYPNVIVMNSGGDGNIPLPLIKGELKYQELEFENFPKVDIGFYGSIDHGPRRFILSEVQQFLSNYPAFKVRMGPSKFWMQDM